MSPTELIIIIACSFSAGVGVTLLGLLIEFSVRKARPEKPVAKPARSDVEGQVEPHSLERVEAPLEVSTEPSPVASAPELPQAASPFATEVHAEEPVQVAPTSIEAAPPETPAEPTEAVVTEVAQPSPEPAPVQTEGAPAQADRAQPPAAAEPVPVARVSRIGFGLKKTRDALMSRLRAIVGGGGKPDEIYEGLEEALIAADVGVEASTALVEGVRKRNPAAANLDAIRDALKAEITAMLTAVERAPIDPSVSPLVTMLVGVNGVGKTTTVAKLAARFKQERGGVIVAAADTFRAAAIDQLEVWCQRVGVDMIKQKQGADPAAVAYDAVRAAIARKIPVVLIDTAGRLQTKTNLMEELKKMARVVDRELPGAPHETWLVLDAMTGQNALSQAKIFGEAVPLSGVILAKLDSSAKGGVVVAVAQRLKLPVRFVGLGEDLEDLRPFDAREFVEALFAPDESAARNTSKSYAA